MSPTPGVPRRAANGGLRGPGGLGKVKVMDVIPFEELISARKQKEEAKREERRAREAAEMFDGLFVGPLLTKRDLEEHRVAIKRLLDEHRAATQRDLGEFRTALRRDIVELRRDLRRVERRLTIRIGTMLVIAVGAMAALERLL